MDYAFYLISNQELLDNFITESLSDGSIKYELILDYSFNHPFEDPSFTMVSVVIEDFNEYKDNLLEANKNQIEEFLKKTWWVSSVYGTGNFFNEAQKKLAKSTAPSLFSILDYELAQYLIGLFNQINMDDLELKYCSSMEFAYEHFKKDLGDWVSMLKQVNIGEFLVVFMG